MADPRDEMIDKAYAKATDPQAANDMLLLEPTERLPTYRDASADIWHPYYDAGGELQGMPLDAAERLPLAAVGERGILEESDLSRARDSISYKKRTQTPSSNAAALDAELSALLPEKIPINDPLGSARTGKTPPPIIDYPGRETLADPFLYQGERLGAFGGNTLGHMLTRTSPPATTTMERVRNLFRGDNPDSVGGIVAGGPVVLTPEQRASGKYAPWTIGEHPEPEKIREMFEASRQIIERPEMFPREAGAMAKTLGIPAEKLPQLMPRIRWALDILDTEFIRAGSVAAKAAAPLQLEQIFAMAIDAYRNDQAGYPELWDENGALWTVEDFQAMEAQGKRWDDSRGGWVDQNGHFTSGAPNGDPVLQETEML